MGELIQLHQPRPSDIAGITQQTWPANRVRGDFRKEVRAKAEQEDRIVMCFHCEAKSPPLNGPLGRAWWAHHKTVCKGTP